MIDYACHLVKLQQHYAKLRLIVIASEYSGINLTRDGGAAGKCEENESR